MNRTWIKHAYISTFFFPILGALKNHSFAMIHISPSHHAFLVSGFWPGPRQQALPYTLTDPTTQWPEAAWEFQTCSSHFINHQNFGYETCYSWNNFTYGVHFVLIINFSFQSLSLYSHQRTSQASSLAWRLALRPVGSISSCASLWSLT